MARRANASRACAPTAWKMRRSCRSTSTATRPARSASPSRTSTHTISTALGSNYVNDFPNRRAACSAWSCRPTRQPHAARRHPQLSTSRTAAASWCRCRRSRPRAGRRGRCRRCATTAIPRAHRRRRAPGFTSGDAIAEMERLAQAAAARLRLRMDRPVAAGKALGLAGAVPARFSLLVVFLCLAALYESWTIPLAVLLTVPLGICGAVLGATMRGLPNDVYFQVGLITIIGLAAKERHPDHRVRQGPARAGQAADRGDARSLRTCASARS
jgi:multidrug efflux pump